MKYLKRFAIVILIGAGLVGSVQIFSDSVSHTLMNYAWAKSLEQQAPQKAWPWMSSYPVAKISFPNEQTMVVMSGSSPAVLAQAPVWHEGTAMPGQTGISLITGNGKRDFDFVKTLAPGDSFELLSAQGMALEYRVEDIRILDDQNLQLVGADQDSILLLSTTYPLKNWERSQGMRMVAIARAIDPRAALHLAGL